MPVHDLHWVVEQGESETMLGPDGTHYTAAGSNRLAEAVADCVLRQLTVRRYRPLARPASGPRLPRSIAGPSPGAMRSSPMHTGVSRSASSASQRMPRPGKTSGRRSSGPSSSRSETSRPGQHPRGPAPSLESSVGVTRSKRSPSPTAWIAR